MLPPCQTFEPRGGHDETHDLVQELWPNAVTNWRRAFWIIGSAEAAQKGLTVRRDLPWGWVR